MPTRVQQLHYLVLILGAWPCAALSSADDESVALHRMVDQEVAEVGIKNERVIAAMRSTRRAQFVPSDERAKAYFDMALPIGHGQSISPPFVVAYMTEQLDPDPADRVLEIGTGSGYQAAVLSPLVKDVYTIEIEESLGKRAASTLARLGYKNIHTRVGDGYQGWPEAAPFDKIIVTCSPEKVPQPLVDQLREGGRLIVPIGERFQQTLYLFKKENGKLVSHALEHTMFVPMTGAAERQRVVQPDGSHPALHGGSFEQLSADTDTPAGWYYLRHAKVQTDPTAPDGKHVITFTNDVPGRSARALQAIAIDGRAVARLNASLWIRAHEVKAGTTPDQTPGFLISFFGEDRKPLGNPQSLEAAVGSFDWQQLEANIPVPVDARMAIVWIGLMGATGEASFDDVTLAIGSSNPSVLPARRISKPSAPQPSDR
ncbi:MAG TPA: protein-L-isoaspartate(D-aspartate) O-methyltransferase [Pirellulales bacterium]|jgi:protein-L-isoaspartate(D-aspartate) O-methyltransferase